MKKRVVVFITIFPAIKHFLDDFFKSLQQQTFQDFDILVVNDGLRNFDYYKKKYPFNIIEYHSQKSPAKNRELGINKAINLGYDFLIFSDVDDFFSPNRIEETVKYLANNDFVYNELTLINSEGKIIVEKYIDSKINLTKFDIYQGNLFGLSNTGICLNLFDEYIQIPKELIAVDWYLFSIIMLQKNVKYTFIPNVITYYRQYESNTVGFVDKFDEKRILKSIKVKKIHYQEMVNFCKRSGKMSAKDIYQNKLNQIKSLEIKLNDKNVLQEYLSIVNNNFNRFNTGWWSEIIEINKF